MLNPFSLDKLEQDNKKKSLYDLFHKKEIVSYYKNTNGIPSDLSRENITS